MATEHFEIWTEDGLWGTVSDREEAKAVANNMAWVFRRGHVRVYRIKRVEEFELTYQPGPPNECGEPLHD